MLFNCPQCGQTLRAADEAAGKKCRCTSCQQLVPIPGGPAKSKTVEAKPTPSAKPPAKPQPPAKPVPKPTVATELDDLIVRQQEQILNQAAQYHQHRAQAERRAEQQQKNRKYYSTSQASSASPLRIILTIVSVVGILLVLGCCGFFGFAVVGRSAELTVDSYIATAKAQGSLQNKSEGNLRGQAVVNRLTGSEFWLIVHNSPTPDPMINELVLGEMTKLAISQQEIQRGNFKGKKLVTNSTSIYSGAGKITADVEVFVDGSKLVMMVYVKGSAKAKAGIQPRSRWESMEDSFDNAESFFSSLSRKTK